MRILDEENNELTEGEYDLSVGYLQREIIIKPDADPVDYETKFAFTNDDYEVIQRYIFIPEATRILTKIDQLERQLADTDYVVIKIAEGAATAEEYSQVIAERRAWRSKINELEKELKDL